MIFYERHKIEPKLNEIMNSTTNTHKLETIYSNSSDFESSDVKDAISKDMPHEFDGGTSMPRVDDDIELGKIEHVQYFHFLCGTK